MREAQILGLNFQEMERREQIAKQKFREVIEEYLETIYKLHGATFWHFKFYRGHFGSSIADILDGYQALVYRAYVSITSNNDDNLFDALLVIQL